jgi:hypothetical protein
MGRDLYNSTPEKARFSAIPVKNRGSCVFPGENAKKARLLRRNDI